MQSVSTLSKSSDSVSVDWFRQGWRRAVSASRDSVRAAVVAHGDARELGQAGDRPPTGELACSGRSQRPAIDGAVGSRSIGCPTGRCAGLGAT
jgi:hypothetical protein